MFAKLFELRDKKLKENKKKGFTLVELIVVLVIIAILAALLIPALTGYINKAKEKSITAETRQVVMAAQTLVDEKYAELNATGADAITVSDDANATVTIDAVKKLAEVSGTIDSVTVTEGKVTAVQYTSQNKTCYYKAGTNGEKGTYSYTAPSGSNTGSN